MPERPMPERMRVSDADRQQVAGHLETAFGEGRLSVADFDDRVRQAWSASTHGDLARLTADLPAVRPAAPVPSAPAENPDDTARKLLRGWFIVTFINVAVWFVIALNEGFTEVHPWWIWVALTWPVVALVVRYSRRRRSGEEP